MQYATVLFKAEQMKKCLASAFKAKSLLPTCSSRSVVMQAGIAAILTLIAVTSLPSQTNAQGGTGTKLRRHIPSDYFWKQRAFPFKSIPVDAYTRAVAQRDRMPVGQIGGETQNRGALSASSTWQSIGPYNWNPLLDGENSYSGTGPISGRINAVAYDPQAPTTIYLGSAAGGVFKSKDNGVTWVALSDNWQFLNISSIAIDPTNSNNVYVGTGDFQGGNNASYVGGTFAHSFGLMKSTNAGVTWKNYGVGLFDDKAISHILVDPDSPNIVTITVGDANPVGGMGLPAPTGAIWRSVDSGATWQKIKGTFIYNSKTYPLDARWCRVVCSVKDTNGKRRYYAVAAVPAIKGDPIVLCASDDQGATWKQVKGPWKSATTTTDVAISPTASGTVYVLATGDQTVYRSIDGGAHWTNINLNLKSITHPTGEDLWDQANYDYFLACSTKTVNGKAQDIVYLGLKEVYQLPDGKTWNSFGQLWRNNGNDAQFHVDQHCVAIHPTDPTQGLFGNDGGIYNFTYDPVKKTSTFTSLNANLSLAQFYGADFHPTNPSILAGGTQDNSTGVLTGDVTKWLSKIGGDGGHAAIDANSPNIQYGTNEQYEALAVTTDGWQTTAPHSLFESLNKTKAGDPNWMVPLVLNTWNTKLLYTGGNVLCTYNVAKKAWTYSPSNGNTLTGGVLLCITVAPSDPNTIYTGADDGEIWMTRDNGSHWRKLNTTGLPTRTVNSIVVSPTSPNAIMVGLSGFGQNGARLDHVWKCNDTKATKLVWTSVSTASSGMPDIPVNTLALDPIQPTTTYYVGTDIGVFQTKDGGNTWLNVTAPLGLPNVQVNELHAVPGQGMLYAATFGRGLYRISLTNNEPLYSLTLLPFRVKGGTSTTGILLLGAPAPSGGATITISSNSAAATVPTQVVVPAGATTATFKITTSAVSTLTAVTITVANTSDPNNPRTARLLLDH